MYALCMEIANPLDYSFVLCHLIILPLFPDLFLNLQYSRIIATARLTLADKEIQIMVNVINSSVMEDINKLYYNNKYHI